MTNNTMTLLPDMKESILPQTRPTHTTNITERLPPEIISTIFKFLCIPDQICLSLSCMYLYNCFRISLSRRDIKMNNLLPRPPAPVLFSDRTYSQRRQLLYRLGNGRWDYCGYFLILHPRSKRDAPRSISRLPRYDPHSDVSYSSGKSCDLPYIGNVALCPCQYHISRSGMAAEEPQKAQSLLRPTIDKYIQVQITLKVST